MRCIVPGCKSGYDSNPKKFHFFTVPRNDDIRKQWRVAIRRFDLVLKSSQAVCENHFKPEDIRSHRELLGPDGSIVGISPYKIPRLRAGAIPCLFPWTENSIPNVIEIKCENVSEAASSPAAQECNGKETSLFDNMIRAGGICLPDSWMQTTDCNGKFVSFVTTKSVDVDGVRRSIVWKEVVLSEDLKVQINVIGQSVNPSVFNQATVAENIENLRDIIFTVNGLNVCIGRESEYNRVRSEVARKDMAGVWRHTKCPVVVMHSVRCEYCTNLKKIEKRKQLRNERNATEKVRLILSPSKQEKLQVLRRKLYTAAKTKRRMQKNIEALQLEMGEFRSKISKTSEGVGLKL